MSFHSIVQVFRSFGLRLNRRYLLVFLLTLVGLHLAYASGNDLLQSAEGDVTATITGSGKVLLYVGEMVAAIISFIATRKYTAFIGVVAIAIFIDVLMKVAGISS